MRYCVLTFGCRANQAESCDIERELQANGGVPAVPEAAQVVVVNTCTVTSAADQAARAAIRRVVRLNPSARIIATGCYATRKPAEVSQLPGVLELVPNAAKRNIAGKIDGLQRGDEEPHRLRAFGLRPGSRGRTAYPLQVQTGCDQRCAYCIVPSTRGPGRSRPVSDVLVELRQAADAGFKELWITGVHIGSYGTDLSPARSLLDLLVALDRAAAEEDVSLRLSSLEPMDCTDEVLGCLTGSSRFLPHLHLPLQHAGDRMLAAMRRPYTFRRFEAIVEMFHRRLPHAAIGTDLIAGFPGEEERDFTEQLDYLRGSPVTHVHVFPYSDRGGTEASRMAAKVNGGEIRRRATALRSIGAQLHQAFLERQLGSERPALTLDDGTVALTDNYIKLRIPAGRERNERLRVRVAAVSPPRGEVVA